MRNLILFIFFSYLNLSLFGDGCSSVSFTATATPNLLCSIDFEGLSVANTDCDYTLPYDYYWDFGDGSPVLYGTTNPSHQYQASGTYDVTFTWEGTCHGQPTICATIQQVIITLPPPPPITSIVSNYNGYNISCYEGSDGAITLNSIGAYTYEWQTIPIQYGENINNLSAGPIEVLAILNGCPTQPISWDLTQPTEITSNITSNTNYNGYDLRCFNDNDGSINLNVNGGVAPGGATDYSYIWSNGKSSQNIYNLKSGIYNVDITDQNNCLHNTSIELIEPKELYVIINSSKDSCGRGVAIAEANVSGGVQEYKYLWSNDTTNYRIENLYEGIYKVDINDANNCIASIQDTVKNVPDPIANFSISPNLKLHQLFEQLEKPIIFSDKSIDNYSTIINWSWEIEDGYNSESQNIKHSFAEVGSYEINLTITNLFGCIDTIKKRVIIEDFIIYIPNSFTPNNDDINDVFEPKGMGVKKYKLAIFNRWGELIFTCEHLSGNEKYDPINQNEKTGWDGTLDRSENIAQLGVYIYKIDLEDVFGETHQYIGEVNLIR